MSGVYPCAYDVRVADSIGARYYEPNWDRFTTPDWSADDGGPDPVPFAELDNPQTLNLYAYVLNNPVSAVDPDGHDCITTSNATEGSITVTVASGTCTGSTGTYIAGTVNINSLTYNGETGEVGYGYTPYTGGGGTGVIALAEAPNDNIAELANDIAALNPGGFIAAFAGASVSAGLAAGPALFAATTEGVADAGAADAALGELEPGPGQIAQAEKVLREEGPASVRKAIRSFERLIAEHEGKISSAAGHTSSMEKEMRNFIQLLKAYRDVLGGGE